MGHALDVLKKVFNGNTESYPCFRRDWREEYLQMLLTNTISNIFYASEEACRDRALELHVFAADEDPEFMARALVFARCEGFMRLQPLVGLAVLSLASPSLFKLAFGHVVRIIPDLVEFTLALESFGRGQGGRMVKREAARKLLAVDEYSALKYAGTGRGYGLRDLLRVYHPRAVDKKTQTIFKYIINGFDAEGLERGLIPQIAAFEKFKAAAIAGDSASAIQAIEEGQLPYNIVTGAAQSMSAGLWGALLLSMPLFALLRHLETLERAGVLNDPAAVDFIRGRFSDPEAIRRAKILPFRFAQAWRMASRDTIRHALERATELSLENLPYVAGATAVLLDVSGSMRGQFLMAGGVLAISTIRKTNGSGVFIIFDTEAVACEIDDKLPILETAAAIPSGGGTDTGAPLRLMTRMRSFADNIVIITDEQQNTGSPFHQELARYRAEINPKARTFVVNVAAYGGAMIPSSDPLTTYCYGWSDQIVSFIARASSGYANLIDEVAAIDLCSAGRELR